MINFLFGVLCGVLLTLCLGVAWLVGATVTDVLFGLFMAFLPVIFTAVAIPVMLWWVAINTQEKVARAARD